MTYRVESQTDTCRPMITTVFLDVHTSDSATSLQPCSSSSWMSTVNGQLCSWPTAMLQQHMPHLNVVLLPCTISPSELRSSKQRGSNAAAALVQAVHALWQHHWQHQSHPQQQRLVLVGHGFGGHMLKEICLQLQHCATQPQYPQHQRQQYAATLCSIAGCVFYSTPHMPLPQLALPEYEYVLPDMADVSTKFKALGAQQGWKMLGIGAARQAGPGSWVPHSAAARGMTHFAAVPAGQADVSRPTGPLDASYVVLTHFLEQLAQDLEVQQRSCIQVATDAAAAVRSFATPQSPDERSGWGWSVLQRQSRSSEPCKGEGPVRRGLLARLGVC